MVGTILATDMAHHMEMVRRLDSMQPMSEWSMDKVDHEFLANIMLHCSDLSGQTFPREIATIWEIRISAEFALEAMQDVEKGILPAPFMQNLDDLANRARLQASHFAFIHSTGNFILRIMPFLI